MKEGMKGPKEGMKGPKQGKNRQMYICPGKDTCIRRFFALLFPCAGVFVLTLAVLAGLLVLTSCIPNESIKERLLDSALSYQQQEPYVFGKNGRFNGIADNYADAILLNVLWNIKSDDPVKSALDTQYYDGEEYGENWGLSYAMAFVTKWAAVSLATGENRFLTSIASAEVRMYGVDAEEGLPLIKQIPYAVFANLSTLFGGRLRVDFPRMLLGMALVFGLWGAIYYLFHGPKNREMFLLMLLLGAVPYVRYLALSNHSYLHEFFTYRAQAATILGMLAALWFQLDKSLLPFTKGRKRTG